MWEANPRFIARGLVNDIRRTFPDLGKVDIAHLWHGTLGRTVHRMPQIGEIERGVWLASGFGGHGLNNTAIAGKLIAGGIIDGDQTWRLFAPYELVWAGGVLGRMMAQGIYWGARPVERVEQEVARFRARARARKDARLTSRSSSVGAP
jgi:2Fe-2S ferredoxin